MNEMFKVLWVEDDPEVIESYPLEAELYGMELCNFSSWDAAKEELCIHRDEYEAVILDAKCKHYNDSHDNARKFLIHALSDLHVFNATGKVLPWYILTGGSEEEIGDLIHEDRERWDADWPKKYYSKNIDRESLFKRIGMHVRSKSEEIKIRNMYAEVFDAVKGIGLKEEFELILARDLLAPLHFGVDWKKYNHESGLGNVRICLEYIRDDMKDKGIIPPDNVITGSQVALILGGLNDKDKKWKINESWKKTEGKDGILPKHVARALGNLLDIVNYGHHNSEDSTAEYLKHTPSHYLAASGVMLLCDHIIWYNHYLREHPCKEKNSEYWIWNGGK